MNPYGICCNWNWTRTSNLRPTHVGLLLFAKRRSVYTCTNTHTNSHSGVCVCMCRCINICISLSLSLLYCVCACLSIHLPICRLVCLSGLPFYLSIWPSIRLCIRQSAYLSICAYCIHLCIRPCFHLICLSGWLAGWLSVCVSNLPIYLTSYL